MNNTASLAEVPDAVDLGPVFRDLMGWVEANLAGKDKLFDMAATIADSTYSDFKIDGERATARQSSPESDTTVRFRKVDGFWYVGD